jgi:hypothetical protein
MAAYSYKEVVFRDDFLAEAARLNREDAYFRQDPYECDPGYDGDCWIVAASLLERKDAEIAHLRSIIDALIPESRGSR